VRGYELPDAKAKALGPDEYGRLEAFLEQGEAVVEVAGRKVALVRDGWYISIVACNVAGQNFCRVLTMCRRRQVLAWT
jgi:hypothetical protein